MTEPNDALDEFLDECYPPVVIAGITFDASRILFELDPIAYRCTVADFESFDDE